LKSPQGDFADVVAILTPSTCYDLLMLRKPVPNYDHRLPIDLGIEGNDGERFDD
jgi:hypothetical protein